MKIEIGKIYQSKICGDFEVLDRDTSKETHHTYYTIRFLQTGYITSARYDVIQSGNINDPYFPKICNIGFIGEPIDGIDRDIYQRWANMIKRCYDTSQMYYNLYGGAGITVCDRWLCYANFAEDFKKLPGYSEMMNNTDTKYSMDKDILQTDVDPSNKVYSSETCMLVPNHVNILQVAKDHFKSHSNKYYNVIEHKGAYNVEIQINNDVKRIGRYRDPEVAANAANYARSLYGLEVLNTDVKHIPQEEVNSQNIRNINKMKVMATVIDK